MALLVCERCKNEIFKSEVCSYCNRRICYNCLKSSLRHRKTTRLVMCKDCWGDLRKRTAFKNKSVGVAKAQAQA